VARLRDLLNEELARALVAWGITRAQAERAPSGNIAETWFVDPPGAPRVVVQKMHPIFGAAVLDDMEAVTAHLALRGLATPRLVRTRDGALSATGADGRLWRVLTYLDGHTVDRVSGPGMARAAAELVGRFHRALGDLDHSYRFVRAGVHDTAAHLGRLEAAAEGDVDGPRRLAADILAAAQAIELAAFAELPRRRTHGDLKISNVLFANDDAVALIDLDTMGFLPLPFELGDAWRSWCNPLGEDVEEARFDLELFTAAVSGYAAAGEATRAEAALLVAGVETIAIELAARFCLDAFEDRYFGWDPKRFPSRREHNRVRAAGQLALARKVAAARRDAEAIVARAWGWPAFFR
jgi:Ser/Thr protein kinase RdoA (MazF antagonist)